MIALRTEKILCTAADYALLFCLALFPAMVFGDESSLAGPPPTIDSNASLIEPASEEETSSSASKTEVLEESPSDAERIAELQETIGEDKTQLDALERELDDPASEYARAESAFRELNEELDQKNEAIEQAKSSGDSLAVQRLEREIASIERKRKLAEARFDLAIEDRRTVRDQMLTLRGKIKKDQAALDELTGEGVPVVSDEAAEKPDVPLEEMSSDSRDTADRGPSVNDTSERKSTAEGSSDDDENDEKPVDEEPMDEEIAEAKLEAEEKEAEADEAQEETQSIADRIADLQKLIAQEQKELSLARKKVQLADAAQLDLTAELQKRQGEKADDAELATLRTETSDASRRLIVARSEVNAITERLNDHRAELGMLQSEHIVALHEAEQKRKEAIAAEEHLASLKNPFALRNIAQWLIDHGFRLIAIGGGMFLLNWIAAFFSQRSIRLVSAGTSRGSKLERENRARTLVGVFQNAVTVAIFITGFLMMLEEVGANVTVLMGGVAVVGLAVAFGAQNLIKDYFYGFVMLLENQYMLNDSIRIGTLCGQVERITLRMTVLRDSSGVVHFVPNGTINSVSNETHGWSRAVCELEVGYEEDLDQVLQFLREIGKTLHLDAQFGSLMLEAPSPPAIEALGESSIRLKMSVKTLPNKHGQVKQEWLRRIHRLFQDQGIQPAYPRTLQMATKSIDASHQTAPRNRSAA